MKYSKIVISALILISFVYISCKKTITEPEVSTIVGNWQFSGAANEWLITTTSDQLVKVPFSGNGQITSFGAYNSVFNGLKVISTDPLVIAAVELEYGIVVTDAMILDVTTGEGRATNSNTDQTFEGIVNYSYDGTTLTITESILTNPQNTTETVTVNGSLSFTTNNVPANSKTYVQVPDVWMYYYHYFYNGTIKTEFFDDNNITRTRYIGQIPVEETGTWDVNNNILTVNIIDGDNTSTELYNLNVDGKILTMEKAFDICIDEEGCLNAYEQLFGIETGSLTELGVEVTSVFSKINQ